MRIKWIEHNNKRILFADFTKLFGEEFLKVLDETKIEVKKQIIPILFLIDYTDSYVDKNVMEKIKELSKKYDDRIKKLAAVGIVGIKKVIGNAVNTFTGQSHKVKFFDKIEDAKNFLCE